MVNWTEVGHSSLEKVVGDTERNGGVGVLVALAAEEVGVPSSEEVAVPLAAWVAVPVPCPPPCV
jgi:hypothetical protein